MVTAPSIFACNYILDGPDTWRDSLVISAKSFEAANPRPVVSVLLRVVSRTIEASCWLFCLWMMFLLYVAANGLYPNVTSDYFAVMIAISVLTAATAVYLFLYKWRWAKALRGSSKP